MSDICLVCVKNTSVKIGSAGSLKARATIANNPLIRMSGIGSLRSRNGAIRGLKAKLLCESNFANRENMTHGLRELSESGEGNIHASLKVTGNIKSRVSGLLNIPSIKTDKFAGSFESLKNIDFQSTEKLYPLSDIITELNGSKFVDQNCNTTNLYSKIDEGVSVGNYVDHGKISNMLADEKLSYIQPSSIYTSGDFRYKFEVSTPSYHARKSFLFIRAAAPTSTYSSDIPPQYKIHNITLNDPSGNLIIKYKDIILRGDADYNTDYTNFTTYITEPETNNLLLNTWDTNYPLMEESNGYTLNLDFSIQCLDDPFDDGFNRGYEDTCVLPSSINVNLPLNPDNSLRISSIELCNSGELGIHKDNYLRFYTEVSPIGQRITRAFAPVEVITNDVDVDIYPESYSLWQSSPDSYGNVSYNTSKLGSEILAAKLQDDAPYNYITAISSSPHADSGRLTLKFSHQQPISIASLADGEFSPSFNRSPFKASQLQKIKPDDNFFVIDDISLKVIARKAVGSDDYALDIVGYSDDGVINITPKVGAFLQNTLDITYVSDQSGNLLVSENSDFIVQTNETGSVPLVSGLKQINDLGLSSESLSDKSQYYTKSLTGNIAGDHYKLSTSPIINSTSFQEYIIPLTIYKDNVELGQSIDYSISSYFENLYLDIYPIPSGASICTAQLVVTYKPSNGLMMHTLGRPSHKDAANRNLTLLPAGWNGSKLNSYASDGPLSIISGIPQGYAEPSTLKTNYARRWRGVDGNIVNGPYDPNQFDFSFYNPTLDTPFLNGYFDFTHSSGNWIIADNYNASGYYNGDSNIIQNIGWRFNSDQLFAKITDYKTLDWTESGDNIYGQISDSFDSVLELPSGKSIEFNNFIPSGGFGIFLRFTPDKNSVSGTFTTVLLHKWLNFPSPLRQAINLQINSSNKLSCLVYDAISNSNKIYTDTKNIYDYQFPLSVLLTYTGSPSGVLRLYARDELSNSDDLRFETEPITLDNNNDFPLLIGSNLINSPNRRLFIHEIGLSASGNLVHESPNRLLKQTTAQSFLDGHSHSFDESANSKFKLHNYIDDKTSLWKLGAFKTCSFSPDFDGFTSRIGKDYIVHTLKHHGSGYSQFTNLPLPSNVNAGGLAYHTQIENDFLRFNLSDMSDNDDTSRFYSAHPRICKTLPRGYQFADRAIVVDTIIQSETYNNISWNDGKIGPKLIVSLYTKNQEPIDRPSKINWGLVNRAIHHLEPSGCWQKLESKFDFDNLIDVTEPWALFDVERNLTEFDHKYYSRDIDDMFLQYDLVYPSGSAFESKIKLHSANVRLEDALVMEENRNAGLNLSSIGEKKWLDNINLHTKGLNVLYDSNNLYVLASSTPSEYVSAPLYVEGGNPRSTLNLFVKTILGSVDSSTQQLFGSLFGTEYYIGPNLYISGRPEKSNDETLQLIIRTDNLITGSSGTISLSTSVDGFINQNDFVNLYLNGVGLQDNRYYTENMSLFIDSPVIPVSYSNNLNLYLDSYNPLISGISNSVGLYTINYPAFSATLSSQAVISWNGNNTGKNISVSDNKYSFLDANDEIRGVDLLCYGDCPSGSCQESSVLLHEELWSTPNTCVDGGILRAKNTYTNLETSGFRTDVGYSGHFYGLRKYTNLIPNAPYKVSITGKTGTNKSIDLPKEFMEVEYGVNDNNDYTGTKIAANKDLLESERQAGDKFGKSVAIRKNLMGIGAPMHKLTYQEGSTVYDLEEAGAVYLYRREERPSGYSWLNDEVKSPWVFETKLTLPSGLLKDYPTSIKKNTIGNIVLPLDITETVWNVGQDGRQFGHSLDIASTTNYKSFEENLREILVVGGPSAKWSRDFEDLQTSGVQIGLMIFTDEFQPTIPKPRVNGIPQLPYSYVDVLNAIKDKDLIFRYFSDPPIRFDVKLIICEPILSSSNVTTIDFPEPKPDFITKKQIERNIGPVNTGRTEAILSGIKDAFHTAFPYDPSKLHNNIPPILGVYVDNSRSLGKKSLNPALTQFMNYYKEYSFASGLRDFYGTRDSGIIVEYTPTLGTSENWIVMSQSILNEVLDTGKLLANNQVRFLTSGVGQDSFNSNLSQFNYPPESGGRVYIFEKESGNWNLIQEIKSPNVTYSTPDRFGHAVALSDDTEVLVVGSPYINEAFKVYEYKPEEKTRLYNGLYSWLTYKNSFTGGLIAKYSELVSDYLSWANEYGVPYANRILYSKLDSTDKFEARQYLNIQEYQNIYTYKYSDIELNCGPWSFIPKHFAPTSRLGYSVAVNEDGTYVACGAPTDSFNEWEDGNVYYQNRGYESPNDTENLNTSLIKPNWRSSVNAGAVRVFESRKYYPHDSVVEFGKFGNLQESMNFPEDSGHFNYLATIFQNKNFRKTEFTEVEIPQRAGLAFIITPEVDALSDEVADNILKWLSLGDRNLVLVGNDPVWEKDGLYEKSNAIINKILERLQSRIRLFSARNSYEALSSGCSIAIPSYIPENATYSYVSPRQLKVNGVADIRMYLGEDNAYRLDMPCSVKSDLLGTETLDREESAFEILNDKCQLPLKNYGDLRAEWISKCRDCKDNPLFYKVNWPFIFKTYNPQCCDPPDEEPFRFNRANQDPIPLLAAADSVTETVTIPATPAVFGYDPIYTYSTVNNYFTIFAEDKIDTTPAFVWDSENNDYSNILYNAYSDSAASVFYKPESFDGRQSLLLANAISQEQIVKDKQLISDYGYYMLEETIQLQSKIMFIAGVETESSNNLYSGFGDENLNFYINIAAKTPNTGSKILQLSSWTGRNSFADAYDQSILKTVFENNLCEVLEGANKLYDDYDICWIANPIGLPSEEQLYELKQWLGLGDKKLIITYDNELSRVRLVKRLSDMLDSKIKPLYLTVDDKYPQVTNEIIYFNTNHYISTGFDQASSISSFGVKNLVFVPLKLVDGTVPVCYINQPIYDTKYDTLGYWKMATGVTKASFPAIPGSGYKIFISTISETPSENQRLNIAIGNVSQNPTSKQDIFACVTSDCKVGITYGALHTTSSAPTPNTINTQTFNVRVYEDKSEIDFYIYDYNDRLNTVTNQYLPKTTRLHSISGVLIPLEQSVKTSQIGQLSGWQKVERRPAQPEITYTTTKFRAIANDNTQYCLSQCADTLGHKLIEDGPIVAAQEVEHFSEFLAGVARSRITLLSDSSLVQGQCMGDEFFRASIESVEFISSLYPHTDFPDTNGGRQYSKMYKLLSPERGSPNKYRSVINNSGINIRFGDGIATPMTLSDFEDKESRYDPRYVKRPLREPWEKEDDPKPPPQEEIELIKQQYIKAFSDNQFSQGGTAMFSGIVNGKLYRDAGMVGGIPEILKDTGHDYLDFDVFPSGYPGDLFGHSVALYKDKLVVGAPFSAFSKDTINNWNYMINGGASSGLALSYNGGAGSVYIFEHNNKGSGLDGRTTAWQFTRKLRPSSLNVGENSGVAVSTDQFGYDIDIDGDIIAVGAPGHDYENFTINTQSSFLRRSFNPEFSISKRTVIDLGSSGNRDLYPNSGLQITNNGAIFTFENRIVDWPTKKQDWIYVEKIVPQGSGDRHINDCFGRSVYIDKTNRSDADYTIVGGAENHVYSTSGTRELESAGSAYSYDIVLRNPVPAIQSPNSYIDATFFGETTSLGEPKLNLRIQNNHYSNKEFTVSGLLYSNDKGEIFIEASGQDPVLKGFIEHRPYIMSVEGQYLYGTPNSGILGLNTIGKVNADQNTNLYTRVDDSAIVYNTIGLYNSAILAFASGIPSGLQLYVHAPDPTTVSESGLCLFTASGVGLQTDTLNMRIRGF